MTSRVLVLEDEKALLRLYTKGLKSEGFEVLSAETMKEAEDILKAEAIDCWVSDINLGFIQGLNTLTKLHRTRQAKGVQIVVISAAMDTYQYHCKDLKLDYLAKPVSYKVLAQRIRNILNQDKQN